MLTIEQCDKAVAEGRMQKHGNIYHVEKRGEEDLHAQIMAANDLKMAFSEWREFYSSRVFSLKEKHGIRDRIVVIPREDCMRYGL